MNTILQFHLMHPGGDSLPGDPNAAFYLDGVYHLHYILGHPWRGKGSFSFVHVTSPDMLRWTWQPTTLQPSFTGHGMFSGTGFLTSEGVPAVIYHGESSGRNQIAIAHDRQLSAWNIPYSVEVKTSDGRDAPINHWDPDCFRIGDLYYAISGGTNPPLFKSTDLHTWTLVGDFLCHDMPDVALGEDISCPNFFQLGDQWMLLCISHPLGCRYYLGDWNHQTEQFVPRRHGRMNWRRDDQPIYGLFQRTDIFAPESVLTPDGRRVMWAWLTSVGLDGALLHKTIQSLPRELSLPSDGILRIAPCKTSRSRILLSRITPSCHHGARLPASASPSLLVMHSNFGSSLHTSRHCASSLASSCLPTVSMPVFRFSSGQTAAWCVSARPKRHSPSPTCRRTRMWNCESSSTTTSSKCLSMIARRSRPPTWNRADLDWTPFVWACRL
jgi:sucrose-6-phosphate hydrolase SacC (GH32 family)